MIDNKSIGNYLKSLREEKELTLEEISQATKIKVKFLQDIEMNKFDNLGGVGYAKAMSYTYGRYLNADLNHLLKLLNKRFPETILQDFDDEPEQIPKRYFFSTSLIPIIIAVIFFIISAFVILKNSHKKQTAIIPSVKTEQTLKKSESEKVKVDAEVLKDTTNYLDKYLFKKKKNPFKADE